MPYIQPSPSHVIRDLRITLESRIVGRSEIDPATIQARLTTGITDLLSQVLIELPDSVVNVTLETWQGNHWTSD